jgi:hypothetical protein
MNSVFAISYGNQNQSLHVTGPPHMAEEAHQISQNPNGKNGNRERRKRG